MRDIWKWFSQITFYLIILYYMYVCFYNFEIRPSEALLKSYLNKFAKIALYLPKTHCWDIFSQQSSKSILMSKSMIINIFKSIFVYVLLPFNFVSNAIKSKYCIRDWITRTTLLANHDQNYCHLVDNCANSV